MGCEEGKVSFLGRFPFPGAPGLGLERAAESRGFWELGSCNPPGQPEFGGCCSLIGVWGSQRGRRRCDPQKTELVGVPRAQPPPPCLEQGWDAQPEQRKRGHGGDPMDETPPSLSHPINGAPLTAPSPVPRSWHTSARPGGALLKPPFLGGALLTDPTPVPRYEVPH